LTLAHKRRILDGVNSPNRPVPAGSSHPAGEFTPTAGVRLPQADESREAGGQRAAEQLARWQANGRYWAAIHKEAKRRNEAGYYGRYGK
jgi:hypothetical protein